MNSPAAVPEAPRLPRELWGTVNGGYTGVAYGSSTQQSPGVDKWLLVKFNFFGVYNSGLKPNPHVFTLVFDRINNNGKIVDHAVDHK